jgi:putative inorganic carbon (HCO3(-)) transporter
MPLPAAGITRSKTFARGSSTTSLGLLTCIAFFSLSTFKIHEAFPILGPLHLPLILGFFAGSALVIHALSFRKEEYSNIGLGWFFLFFLSSSLSVVFAQNRSVAAGYWIETFWKIGIMTYALAILTRGERDFGLVIRILLAGGAAISLIAISNRLSGIGLVEGSRVTIGREIHSALGDPNDLAFLLMLPFSLSTGLFLLPSTKFDKLFALGCGVLMMCAIIATQSRGGLLGVTTALALAVSRALKPKLITVVAAAGIGCLMYFLMDISGRFSGGYNEVGLDESAQLRLEAWATAINMAISHPMTGVGLNNFTPSYEIFTEHFIGRDMAAHSIWLGVLAETGVPGFVAFCGMILSAIATSSRSLRELTETNAPRMPRAVAIGVIGGLAGSCVAGSFLTQGFAWPLYALVALSAAISRYEKARSETPGRARHARSCTIA